jgi:hypothetical protein
MRRQSRFKTLTKEEKDIQKLTQAILSSLRDARQTEKILDQKMATPQDIKLFQQQVFQLSEHLIKANNCSYGAICIERTLNNFLRKSAGRQKKNALFSDLLQNIYSQVFIISTNSPEYLDEKLWITFLKRIATNKPKAPPHYAADLFISAAQGKLIDGYLTTQETSRQQSFFNIIQQLRNGKFLTVQLFRQMVQSFFRRTQFKAVLEWLEYPPDSSSNYIELINSISLELIKILFENDQVLLKKLGDDPEKLLDKAQKYLRQAADCKPPHAEAIQYLAFLYALQGNTLEAIHYINQCKVYDIKLTVPEIKVYYLFHSYHGVGVSQNSALAKSFMDSLFEAENPMFYSVLPCMPWHLFYSLEKCLSIIDNFFNKLESKKIFPEPLCVRAMSENGCVQNLSAYINTQESIYWKRACDYFRLAENLGTTVASKFNFSTEIQPGVELAKQAIAAVKEFSLTYFEEEKSTWNPFELTKKRANLLDSEALRLSINMTQKINQSRHYGDFWSYITDDFSDYSQYLATLLKIIPIKPGNCLIAINIMCQLQVNPDEEHEKIIIIAIINSLFENHARLNLELLVPGLYRFMSQLGLPADLNSRKQFLNVIELVIDTRTLTNKQQCLFLYGLACWHCTSLKSERVAIEKLANDIMKKIVFSRGDFNAIDIHQIISSCFYFYTVNKKNLLIGQLMAILQMLAKDDSALSISDNITVSTLQKYIMAQFQMYFPQCQIIPELKRESKFKHFRISRSIDFSVQSPKGEIDVQVEGPSHCLFRYNQNSVIYIPKTIVRNKITGYLRFHDQKIKDTKTVQINPFDRGGLTIFTDGSDKEAKSRQQCFIILRSAFQTYLEFPTELYYLHLSFQLQKHEEWRKKDYKKVKISDPYSLLVLGYLQHSELMSIRKNAGTTAGLGKSVNELYETLDMTNGFTSGGMTNLI